MPTPTTAAAIVDPHSHARPADVVVRHFGLALDVDFATRTLAGVITIAVARHDTRAPLRLDTSALTIAKIEVARSDASLDVEKTRIAELDAKWRATTWTTTPLGDGLGEGLDVMLDGDVDLVRITYRTAPGASGLQWLTPEQTGDRKAPFLYSQSQTVHARSWFPCQDSPGVRTTYDAIVRTPAGVRALMSADPLARDGGPAAFEMRLPVPAYLVALAVGAVDFAPIGARTGVWAEPSMLPRAKAELADIEGMLTAIETLYGPYRWGRYDVLVLPPAFPFGGMENPKLTFATPTIIAGDRSLVSLIAHELAHSWSGNLVTNATWADLWLNEGFTVYIERRIIEALFGRERADMDAVLGRQDLAEAFAELGDDDERLRLELDGRNPDDGMSDVQYEKGALLLLALERAYGRERFDPFVLAWFDAHAFGSVTTAQFEAFAAEHLFSAPPLPGQAPVDLSAWLDRPALPTDAPAPQAAAFVRVDEALAGFAAGKHTARTLPTDGWAPQQWLHFLRGLPKGVGAAKLKALDARYALTDSGNAEIAAQWLELSVREGHRQADASLEEFLRTVGRRKFLMPLYAALLAADRKADAARIYASARAGYHPITQASLDALLGAPTAAP
jgi:leukotriene-A4 hydrolase